MRIADNVSKEQKQQLDNINTTKKKQQKKKKEEKVNWHEIMGMNRDRYGRRNGAVRRK